MAISYHIQKILEEKKITDILSERNILPAKTYADKLMYHCPIHKGDNDPSFIVYIGGKYQTYFCYGCKSGTNVINLLSALDDIPIRTSVKKLVKNINIEEIDVVNSICNAIMEGDIVDMDTRIEKALLPIYHTCYIYLRDVVYFNKEEVSFVDEFYKYLDKISHQRDVESLEAIRKLIAIAIVKRTELYIEKEKEKRVIQR